MKRVYEEIDQTVEKLKSMDAFNRGKAEGLSQAKKMIQEYEYCKKDVDAAAKLSASSLYGCPGGLKWPKMFRGNDMPIIESKREYAFDRRRTYNDERKEISMLMDQLDSQKQQMNQKNKLIGMFKQTCDEKRNKLRSAHEHIGTLNKEINRLAEGLSQANQERSELLEKMRKMECENFIFQNTVPRPAYAGPFPPKLKYMDLTMEEIDNAIHRYKYGNT